MCVLQISWSLCLWKVLPRLLLLLFLKLINQAGSRCCRSIDETWSLLPLGYRPTFTTFIITRGRWLVLHVLPTIFVGYALSCLISGGKMAWVWRKIEEYFARLANWHENYGNRDLIFVAWLNSEFMAEIPLRNFKLNCCKLSSDSLLNQITWGHGCFTEASWLISS